MLTLHSKIPYADPASQPICGQLVLRYDQREKSRLRATLSSGEEVALYTVRGSVLRGGDLLQGIDGRVVQIVAASEAVYRVECASTHELLRCAFHLGNRHTQAQIGHGGEHGFLRIRQDSVLKEMLEGLGAVVVAENAPFEPEAGAYGGGHHHGDAGHGSDGHPANPLAPNLLAPVPLRQKIHRGTDPQAA
jgi:urease accessory protein